MKASRITIKDLARELGISKSTVSRALRGHPNVKKDTREAVLALAEKLDYQPDQIALSLVHRKTFTIGVVVPNVSFPYFSHVLSGAQETAAAEGYQVIICQSMESYEEEKKIIQNLTANRIDGLLLSISLETQEFDHIHSLHNRGIPVVLFDRVFGSGNYSQVIMDNYSAAYNATKHLIEQGNKRIAHIAGPQRLLVCQQRLQGYLEALYEAGIPEDESLIVDTGFHKESGAKAMEILLELEQRPDAVLAVADGAAIGAKSVLEERGIRVPEDIALVGFNNEPYTEFVQPALTTIAYPKRELGIAATKLLLEHLNHPGVMEPKLQVLGSELIVRESSVRK